MVKFHRDIAAGLTALGCENVRFDRNRDRHPFFYFNVGGQSYRISVPMTPGKLFALNAAIRRARAAIRGAA